MRSFFAVVLVAALYVLAGCASREPEQKLEPPPPPPPGPYMATDLAELMRFAGKLAAADPDERLEESRKLQELSANDRALGVRLHLLLARSLNGAPGETRGAIDLIDAVFPEIGDEGLKSFLVYQKAILARLERETDRRKALEKLATKIRVKEKKTYSRLKFQENELKSQESELKSQENELKSQESELKAIQQKLDALKAIERSLNVPTNRH